jgi:hypothetical protein
MVCARGWHRHLVLHKLCISFLDRCFDGHFLGDRDSHVPHHQCPFPVAVGSLSTVTSLTILCLNFSRFCFV